MNLNFKLSINFTLLTQLTSRTIRNICIEQILLHIKLLIKKRNSQKMKNMKIILHISTFYRSHRPFFYFF